MRHPTNLFERRIRSIRFSAEPLSIVYRNEFKALERRFAGPDVAHPVIGLLDVDSLIGSIAPGSVIAVGSESGGLRSAMLTGIALANARAGLRTHLATTEFAPG